MKVYKLIGGPLDGDEQTHTNAQHPMELTYSLNGRYHEYRFESIEQQVHNDNWGDYNAILIYRHANQEKK